MLARQDLHVHTNLSLCAKPEATLSGFIEAAKKLGLDTIAITDHFWDSAIPTASPWYQKQNFEHISVIRKEIEANRNCGIRVLFGAEAEYAYERRGIAITEEIAAQMECLLVPNSHTQCTMPKAFYADYRRHAEFMIQAFHDIMNDPLSKYVKAIPHPFAASGCPYLNSFLPLLITDREFSDCFDEAAKKGIAIEINGAELGVYSDSQLEQCWQIRMFRIAKRCGCKFTYGSDAHTPVHEEALIMSEKAALILGLKEEDILVI